MDVAIESNAGKKLRDIYSGIKIPTDSASLVDDVYVDSGFHRNDSGFSSFVKGDSFSSKAFAPSISLNGNAESDVLNTAYIEGCDITFSTSCPVSLTDVSDKDVSSAFDVKSNTLHDTIGKYVDLLSIENELDVKPRSEVVTNTGVCHNAVEQSSDAVAVFPVPTNPNLSPSMTMSPRFPNLTESNWAENREILDGKCQVAKKINYFPPLLAMEKTPPEKCKKSFPDTSEASKVVTQEWEGVVEAPSYKTELIKEYDVEPALKCPKKPLTVELKQNVCLQQEFTCDDIYEEKIMENPRHQALTHSKTETEPACIPRVGINAKLIRKLIENQLRSSHPLLERESVPDVYSCRMFKNLSTIPEVDSDLSKGSDSSSNFEKSIKNEQPISKVSKPANIKIPCKAYNFENTYSPSKKHSNFKSRIPSLPLTQRPNVLNKISKKSIITNSLKSKLSTNSPIKCSFKPSNATPRKHLKVNVTQTKSPMKFCKSPSTNKNNQLKLKKNDQPRVSESNYSKGKAQNGIVQCKAHDFASVGSHFSSIPEEKGVLEEPELTLIGPELTLHSAVIDDTHKHKKTMPKESTLENMSESLMSFMIHEAICMNDSNPEVSLLN